MRGMKITVDAAMRARDVSRPRPEHEEMARESEPAAGVPGGERVKPGPDGQAGAAVAGHPASPADEAAAGPDRTPRPGSGRRRRRHRLRAPGGLVGTAEQRLVRTAENPVPQICPVITGQIWGGSGYWSAAGTEMPE
jgi:hypothetical protein